MACRYVLQGMQNVLKYSVRCQHLKNQQISYFKDPDFHIFFLEKLEDLASLGWTLKHQKLAEAEYGLSLL